MSSATQTTAQELRITLPNGLECALRLHGPAEAPPMLALHGWQDNAASFDKLAALLPQYRIVAMDFPGHGRSARRPLSAPYYLWGYTAEVRAVVEHFGWRQFVLLGHSMGGAVGCLYAALYPQELSKLILLDIVGPISTSPAQLPAQMREALAQLDSPKGRQRHYYADFNAAVHARAEKGLAIDAAQTLAGRSVVCDEQGCYWDMDPRLRVLSVMSMSEDQIEAFLREIQCPTLTILSKKFWETRQAMLQRRKPWLTTSRFVELGGGHHQHMEDKAAEIAALISEFLA
ncbi:MAG TPA: alpha/beta hydrolase [Candidatus Acidoferrum sp.]|nr:alpha/beta hydrolase [Candidatus Acidoferrum sp.]